jgi:hypothetical protein
MNQKKACNLGILLIGRRFYINRNRYWLSCIVKKRKEKKRASGISSRKDFEAQKEFFKREFLFFTMGWLLVISAFVEYLLIQWEFGKP